MGTRHLICVVKNGEYKVAQYGQWDGYPDGQGTGVLKFLTGMNKELFTQKVEQLSFATEEEHKQTYIDAGAEPNSEWVTMDVSDRHKKLYPENSRDTGSDILGMVQNSTKPLKLINGIDFADDSLFCEWAYVVDLDKNTFEVYEGFNKTPLAESERFYKAEQGKMEYYPVKHVISHNLNALPLEDEFLSFFKTESEEDE